MEQRSVEWYQERLGRFTASEITRLLGKLSTQVGQSAFDSYCMEKAIESLYGMIEEDYVSFDMQRGIDLEPLAFEKFSELMSGDFITVEKSGFILFGEHAGASPDGKVDKINTLEIKCPTPTNFFKLAINGVVPEKHFAQMQMQMLCLESDKGYYFNYCTHLGNEYHHTIEVPRNEPMITLIKERIEQAAEKKLEYVKKLKSVFLAHQDHELKTMIVEPITT